jgi:hypothetical protein
MLMKTFIEHLVGIEDVECTATYRAAVKEWQSGHYVAPGLAVIHDSRRCSEPRLNADCGGYAIDTLAGHDALDRHHRCRARRTAGAPWVLHAASTTLFMPSIGGDAA